VANTYVSNDSLASTLGSYSTSEKIAEEYVSKTGLSTTLESYSTTDKIAEDYVSKTGLSTTLADYAKSSDIPTDYVSDSEFSEEIAKYETATTAAGKYAPKAETEEALSNRFTKEEVNSLLAGKVGVLDGYSLVADDEIERLAKVNENAEENYINDVSDKFTVVEEKLDLVAVPQNIVSGLNKTTWTVETTLDEEGKEINNFVASTAPATLAEILQPASYDAESKTGTSGLMTAEQAQKLSALVIGEEGIEISGSVNADNVTGLGSWITNNRDKVEGLFPVESANLLNTLNTTINAETTGLVAKVGVLETKVGSLETLTATHSSEIKALQEAMTWVDMDEPEVTE
jgi:hypothetical protein